MQVNYWHNINNWVRSSADTQRLSEKRYVGRAHPLNKCGGMLLGHAPGPNTEGSVFHIAKGYAKDELYVLDLVNLKQQTGEIFTLCAI